MISLFEQLFLDTGIIRFRLMILNGLVTGLVLVCFEAIFLEVIEAKMFLTPSLIYFTIF